ncbi:50S ribosomal protein L3 [Theileria orientalis]|uniref:Large ribosomal subunit protein uL3c n=1 Tax=Theileria orientalis TaxID=68886 RepID=A0A976XJV2_THEOR|nr:50S ribosomal protein L3 [Theileria orientalis]
MVCYCVLRVRRTVRLSISSGMCIRKSFLNKCKFINDMIIRCRNINKYIIAINILYLFCIIGSEGMLLRICAVVGFNISQHRKQINTINDGLCNSKKNGFGLNIALERDLPGTRRVLIYKDPQMPRDYLWNIKWPETAKIVQLRAEKYSVGQICSPEGALQTVTALKVLPCTICQFMDFGYALVSYGTVLLSCSVKIHINITGKPLWRRHWNNRPELGKLIKVLSNHAETFPVKLQPPQDYVLGQIVDVSSFVGCSHVKVTGISRGKGFQGTIKRHGFKRGPMTHGSKHHRGPGSIGASTTPGCVKPGKKMAGRMGGNKCTFRKLKVLGLNPETSMMYVKGLVAGPKGSYVTVTSDVQPPLKKLLK